MPEMSAVEGLTLETPALKSLYGGQLTLSTKLIKPKHLNNNCLLWVYYKQKTSEFSFYSFNRLQKKKENKEEGKQVSNLDFSAMKKSCESSKGRGSSL